MSKTESLTHPKYRKDVDGLRAIAVLSVVIFHAFPWLIPGGFIGVDIFFVISGYLISTIIYSNLEHKRFSILEFYNRRIRRILPTLNTVLFASLLFGWFALLSDEYMQLGKHIAGGSGFISNFVLWTETGYFDNLADSKPMVHLWSLAIEEQFYLFWPLALAWIYHKKWNMLHFTAILAVISFALNIIILFQDPSTDFYFPFTRFWELLIGALLAYQVQHKKTIPLKPNLQSLLGFSLLAFGLILISKYVAFPGWWALIPTFGAFFIISAGPEAFFNRVLLSNRPMVWIGLISYPLYLWHWPVMSFSTIIGLGQGKPMKMAYVLLSIFLAWITYRFIEKPIRFGKSNKIPLVLFALLILLGGIGLTIYKHNGFEGYGYRTLDKSEFSRYFENSKPEFHYFKTENVQELLQFQCDFKASVATKKSNDSIPIDSLCYVRDSKKPKALFIWGDSHAQHLHAGIIKYLPSDWQILQVASSGCEPNLVANHSLNKAYCDPSNELALQSIQKGKPDVVIVAQNLHHQIEKMNQIADSLKHLGVSKVIFPGPTPHWEADLPKLVLRKMWDNTPVYTFTGLNRKILKQDQELKANFIRNPSQQYISIIDFFCNQEGCQTHIGNDRMRGITSWDYGHLTPTASRALAERLLIPAILNP